MSNNPFPSGGQPELNFRVQYRQWVLTIFDVQNQLPRFLEWIASLPTDSLKDWFYGAEIAPQNQTLHVHMGIWFSDQLRFTAFRRKLQDAALSAWIAPMKGTWEEAEAYALKDPSHTDSSTVDTVDGPRPSCRRASLSKRSPTTRKRNSAELDQALALTLQGRKHQALARLTPAQAVHLAPKMGMAAQLIPSRTYAPLCVWIYGPSGSGKTLLVQCLERSLGLQAHWADLKVDSKFWNGYSGQEMLVIDEARPESLPFALFLKLINSAPFCVEIKNFFVPVTSPLVIVTSPNPPYDFWPEAVSQSGHPCDIEQVRRRLSAVVRVTLDSSPVLAKTDPWVKTPTFQLPSGLAHLVPPPPVPVLDPQGPLPDGWSVQSSSLTRPERLIWTADPTTTCLIPKPLRLTLTPRSPHPVFDEQSPSDPSDSSPQGPSTWLDVIRLPEGVADDLRSLMIQTLSEDLEFQTFYCVEHRCVTSQIAQLLERHYFSDFLF